MPILVVILSDPERGERGVEGPASRPSAAMMGKISLYLARIHSERGRETGQSHGRSLLPNRVRHAFGAGMFRRGSRREAARIAQGEALGMHFRGINPPRRGGSNPDED